MRISELMLNVWQLPQILLGYTVVAVTRARFHALYKDAKIFIPKKAQFGVSLGPIIILSGAFLSARVIKHEYGHSLQSKMLGPLYLLVVGLPSITFNILTRVGLLKPSMYYKRYPENWADRLGGVDAI